MGLKTGWGIWEVGKQRWSKDERILKTFDFAVDFAVDSAVDSLK